MTRAAAATLPGMTEIAIRQAVATDVPGLVASSIELFTEDAGTRDTTLSRDWPRLHAAGSFAEGIADPNQLILVVDADGEVVGHLTGVRSDPIMIRPIAVATLVSMYVIPRYRDIGIGAQLVEAFRAWAKDYGAKRIGVTAYAGNSAAIRFYERQGFTPSSVLLETSP
jgi:GNAT superfamily N-acetyltransferase